MPAVTIHVDELNLVALQETAQDRQISVEAVIEEIVQDSVARKRTIREAADYALKKNAELYRRLAK